MPSTSLMFLPYTVEGEDLPAGFQFAREKARALAAWPAALETGSAPSVAQPPPVAWPELGDLRERAPRDDRAAAQADLNLPPYPTTTTGSLPQTTEVRQLRVRLGRGELSRPDYDSAMAVLITDSIGWQERMGIDVLVHGEFERTDMVEYFAEKMDGFLTTHNGWVNSYGSRCVRAPILAAPPTISEPMTVAEWRIAQDATDKPVKGMLTGPVTIVNWSFRPPGVPDDKLFWAVAQPIADEVRHLVDAGARVIQVDEPAVRERWPLPTEDAPRLREIYARGVRAALNHVFNQPPSVQMHTHMCYGDFGDIVPLWSDAGVDVASIEFSRSKDDSYIRQFYGLFSDGHLQIGPGVFDVHSPHTPGATVMSERLHHFRAFMDEADLWVNPDCGLKTRGWDEIEQQLGDMVSAALVSCGLRSPRSALAAHRVDRDGRAQSAAAAEHDPSRAPRPVAQHPHHRQPVQAGPGVAVCVRRARHARCPRRPPDRRLLDARPEHPRHRVGGPRGHRQRRRVVPGGPGRHAPRGRALEQQLRDRRVPQGAPGRDLAGLVRGRHEHPFTQVDAAAPDRGRRPVPHHRPGHGSRHGASRSPIASSCIRRIRRSTSRSRRRSRRRWVKRLESVGAIPITDALRERMVGLSEAEARAHGWQAAKDAAARARDAGFAGMVLMGLRFETVVGEAFDVWHS